MAAIGSWPYGRVILPIAYSRMCSSPRTSRAIEPHCTSELGGSRVMVFLCEACEDDEGMHLVMELCEDGELFDASSSGSTTLSAPRLSSPQPTVEVVQLTAERGRTNSPESYTAVRANPISSCATRTE